MSDNKRSSIDKKIGSSLQTKLNKDVRDAILDEAHSELLAKLNCEHRTKSVVSVTTMMHPLKPTMDKLMGTTHALKVGDWVEVLYAYAPGLCSDGGMEKLSPLNMTKTGKRAAM
jgi:hypothetical protein